jgi:hypothetical protein
MNWQTHPWAVRIVGVVVATLLGALIAWMAGVSSNQIGFAATDGEFRSQLLQLEKRFESNREEELVRYKGLRDDIRGLVGRIESKIDRLLQKDVAAGDVINP